MESTVGPAKLSPAIGDKITEKATTTGYNKIIKKQEDFDMSAINVNRNNFNQEVLNSDKPVLMDFWAPWCGPCRMVGPLLEEIAKERSDIKVEIGRAHV